MSQGGSLSIRTISTKSRLVIGGMTSSSSHPKPNYVPSREKIAELMRQILSFIEREIPVQDMRVLFPAIQRILVEIDNDLDRFFTVHLSYNTSDTAISRIMPMWDYTSFEMIDVVSRSPFLFLLPYFSFLNNFPITPSSDSRGSKPDAAACSAFLLVVSGLNHDGE